MDSEAASFNVSAHKNNKYMFFNGKKRYIEVLQCSGEDMNNILLGLVPSNLMTPNVQRQPMYSPHRGIEYASMKKKTFYIYLSSSTTCTYFYDSITNASTHNAYFSWCSSISSCNSDEYCSLYTTTSNIVCITNSRYEWASSECCLLSYAIRILSDAIYLAIDLFTSWTYASRSCNTCTAR